MESQNQEIVASGSPAEVPNDPGKMFIGGLSWQTSPDCKIPLFCNKDQRSVLYMSLKNYFMKNIFIAALSHREILF
ncbi:hypothetical protein ACFW04_002555 [Cataglyphis niger]